METLTAFLYANGLFQGRLAEVRISFTELCRMVDVPNEVPSEQKSKQKYCISHHGLNGLVNRSISPTHTLDVLF